MEKSENLHERPGTRNNVIFSLQNQDVDSFLREAEATEQSDRPTSHDNHTVRLSHSSTFFALAHIDVGICLISDLGILNPTLLVKLAARGFFSVR